MFIKMQKSIKEKFHNRHHATGGHSWYEFHGFRDFGKALIGTQVNPLKNASTVNPRIKIPEYAPVLMCVMEVIRISIYRDSLNSTNFRAKRIRSIQKIVLFEN